MKIYVASSFARKPDVRAMHELLRAEGHEITYDWTDEDASGLEGDALHAALLGGAQRDIAGIREANLLVVLHDDRGRGMATEFGIALERSVPIIVVGARVNFGEMRNVFYYLPNVMHVTAPADVMTLLRVWTRMAA
jgi:hypothetical protein